MICTKFAVKAADVPRKNQPDFVGNPAEGVVRGVAYRPRQRVLLAARLECRLAAGPRNGDELRSLLVL